MVEPQRSNRWHLGEVSSAANLEDSLKHAPTSKQSFTTRRCYTFGMSHVWVFLCRTTRPYKRNQLPLSLISYHLFIGQNFSRFFRNHFVFDQVRILIWVANARSRLTLVASYVSWLRTLLKQMRLRVRRRVSDSNTTCPGLSKTRLHIQKNHLRTPSLYLLYEL